MKKLLMMLMLICTVNIACWADGDEPETEGDEVELYDDEEIDPIKEGDLGNPLPRMPRKPIKVRINDHTLSIRNISSIYQIRVVEDNLDKTTVYQTFIIGNGHDTIQLPEYLQGDYRLQLIVGDRSLFGYINL
ncbi:MAG: DUF3244 domain-containing protein [Prevotella sp.]|nr:DUF3244 domain-containing protein [Prevotella sp.]